VRIRHGILNWGCDRQRRGQAGAQPGSVDGGLMVFSLDKWLLPAIAAASSSYLVCLGWERFKTTTAPSRLISAFLAGMSFVMGAFSAYYRDVLYSPSLENNIIIMFVVGATSTFFWLLLRKYLQPGRRHQSQT
jgi:hypothetical protein